MKFGYIGLNKVALGQPVQPCQCPDCRCRDRSVEAVCFDCRHGHHLRPLPPHWAKEKN